MCAPWLLIVAAYTQLLSRPLILSHCSLNATPVTNELHEAQCVTWNTYWRDITILWLIFQYSFQSPYKAENLYVSRQNYQEKNIKRVYMHRGSPEEKCSTNNSNLAVVALVPLLQCKPQIRYRHIQGTFRESSYSIQKGIICMLAERNQDTKCASLDMLWGAQRCKICILVWRG